MKVFISLVLALVSINLMAGPPAFAIPLEAPYVESLSTMSVPAKYHFVDVGWAWTDLEKAVIREALREWDERICDVTSFIEDPVAGFSFDWAGDAVFNNLWGKDYTDVLALAVPTGASNVPPGVATNEIYFNVKYAWYVDPTPTTDEVFANYDLLSVAKHEIGHILGIPGDYEDPARRGEVMWYAFAKGERRHPSEKDFNELRKLGYHVTPEPAVVLLLGIGLLGIAVVRRRISA